MSTNENERFTQPVQSTPTASSSTTLCTLPYPSSGFPNTCYKSAASMELIKTTLLNSDLCSNLEPYCINFMADKMVLEEYLEGDTIIEEGSPGGKLYIVECKNFLMIFKCILILTRISLIGCIFVCGLPSRWTGASF